MAILESHSPQAVQKENHREENDQRTDGGDNVTRAIDGVRIGKNIGEHADERNECSRHEAAGNHSSTIAHNETCNQ